MKKIFILDDNEDFLDILQMVIGKKYVIQCKQNTEGLDVALTDFNPDLIIIDHFIGTLLAENVLKKLKETMPGFNIPFMLFSASPDIKEKAERIGAAGYVEKPASIDYMRSYIDNFFSNQP